MKKIVLSFVILTFIIMGCSLIQTKPVDRFQTTILPEYVKNLYLGMPLKEFKEINEEKSSLIEENLMSFRYEFDETVNDENLESIVYYFDTDIPAQPLYEMIFIYKPDFDVKAYADSMYGKPTVLFHLPYDEWCWDSQEGFKILAWTFENKLVIIAAMKKTEWGELDVCGNK